MQTLPPEFQGISPDQLQDPVSFFFVPLAIGPAALIGLGALLTGPDPGPIGWSWTELNYHVFGRHARETMEELMTSIHRRLDMINVELEAGFT